jgi:hypothetical protein
MSASTEDFLIIDIGTSWTKAFLVTNIEKNPLRAYLKLPTSSDDLRYTTGLLIDKFKTKTKNPKIIITSTFDEASTLTKVFSGSFVSKEQVASELSEWFGLENFENPMVLDGGASNYLRNFRVADIGAYLSFPINETELENFIGNKTLRPQSIPEEKKALEIEEAILRASFSTHPDFHNPNKFNTIIVTGGILSWSSKPTRLALILLDLMSAVKVVQVLQDPLAFMNAYGALINQRKSFKRTDFQYLRNVGSIVSLGGEGRVSLDYGLSEVQEVAVAENEIALVPAAASQKIKLRVLGDKKKELIVAGGVLGVILDGRLKPLPLHFGQQKTRQDVASWQKALDKVELIEI